MHQRLEHLPTQTIIYEAPPSRPKRPSKPHTDLRCLDAHAHLGNLEFERSPEQAMLHYEMGTFIGELSLSKSFAGVLPWGLIDNRPYLRCLHGMGLCAWRRGDLRAASAVFTKMLWLNPGDNQGARFNLAAVDTGKTWAEMQGR